MEYYFDEDVPKCPYCKFKDEEWWDGGIGESAGWGEYVDYECSSCGKTFSLERKISWTSKTKD